MNQETSGFRLLSKVGGIRNVLDQLGMSVSGPPQLIFGLLIATDAIFIGLHTSRMTIGYPRSISWSIEKDQGLAELFQHIKLLWVVGLLLVMARSVRDWKLIPWAILFGVILVDDHIALHERLGGKLKSAWIEGDLPLNLRPQDLGEVTAFALSGTLPLALILVGYLSGGPESRGLQRLIGAYFAGLVFFGAGVDLLHQMAANSRFYNWVGLLEDAGEMVVVSLLVTFLFNRLCTEASKDPLVSA